MAAAEPLRSVLCAFDVDGTLWTSAGPITEATLVHLKELGAPVLIVSPSGLRPNGWLACIPGPNRRDNLMMARDLHPECKLRLYISDNGDVGEAEAAGFCYIDRMSFRLA